MTTFLAFLSTAVHFALTLSLKAAIVAAGFILMGIRAPPTLTFCNNFAVCSFSAKT